METSIILSDSYISFNNSNIPYIPIKGPILSFYKLSFFEIMISAVFLLSNISVVKATIPDVGDVAEYDYYYPDNNSTGNFTEYDYYDYNNTENLTNFSNYSTTTIGFSNKQPEYYYRLFDTLIYYLFPRITPGWAFIFNILITSIAFALIVIVILAIIFIIKKYFGKYRKYRGVRF